MQFFDNVSEFTNILSQNIQHIIVIGKVCNQKVALRHIFLVSRDMDLFGKHFSK